MRAIEILSEQAPSRKEFQQILSNPAIKMGFECEMLLSAKTLSHTVNPNNLTWDQLKEYLHETPIATNTLQREYEDAFQEYVNEEWEAEREEYTIQWCIEHDKLITNKRKMIKQWSDDAHEVWLDEASHRLRGKFTIDDFISQKYGSNLRLMTYLKLSPIFGWSEEDQIYTSPNQKGENAVRRDAAKSLGNVIGQQVIFTSPELGQESHQWAIKDDESVKTPYDNEVAAEIVSPVDTLEKSLQNMFAVFQWMDQNEHQTNNTTGLHVTLSIDGADNKDFDYLKMMIFYDENYVANMFKRMGNKNAEMMRQKLRYYITNLTTGLPYRIIEPAELMQSRDLSRVTRLLKQIGERLVPTFGKYASIRSRKNGSFEFRNMGNEDYQHRFLQIRNNVVRMAYALMIARDEKLFAKEYVTKVANMLGSGKFHDPTLGAGKINVPSGLESLTSLFLANKTLQEKTIPNMILEIALEVEIDIMRLTPTQIKELRSYITRERSRLGQKFFDKLKKFKNFSHIMATGLDNPSEDQ